MNVLPLFKNISGFVFDMDGVLTDGTLLILPEGLAVRRMNIKDGYAIQLAVKKGYRVAIVSGGYSPEAVDRFKKLGITDIFMRVENKLDCLKGFVEKNNLAAPNLLFMGDDIPDYEVMRFVGLPCCPADAAPEIKEIAQYISPLKGGEGCVRDVIERVLKLRGDWSIDPRIQSR